MSQLSNDKAVYTHARIQDPFAADGDQLDPFALRFASCISEEEEEEAGIYEPDLGVFVVAPYAWGRHGKAIGVWVDLKARWTDQVAAIRGMLETSPDPSDHCSAVVLVADGTCDAPQRISFQTLSLEDLEDLGDLLVLKGIDADVFDAAVSAFDGARYAISSLTEDPDRYLGLFADAETYAEEHLDQRDLLHDLDPIVRDNINLSGVVQTLICDGYKFVNGGQCYVFRPR